MKIKLVVSFLLACVLSASAFNVQSSWNAPTNADGTIYNGTGANSIGYCIHWSTDGTNFTNAVCVGNVTNTIISGFSNSPVYFLASSYTSLEDSFTYSNEAVYTNAVNTNTYIYLGELVTYGNSLTNLNTFSIMTFVDNQTNNDFYGAELVQTNAPVLGVAPNDGNYYVYLVQLLTYGNKLTNLTSAEFDLGCFTNPVAQFYSGELILTNTSF